MLGFLCFVHVMSCNAHVRLTLNKLRQRKILRKSISDKQRQLHGKLEEKRLHDTLVGTLNIEIAMIVCMYCRQGSCFHGNATICALNSKMVSGKKQR